MPDDSTLFGPDGLRDPLAILYLASQQEIGLRLRVSDPDVARAAFMKARREAADFELTNLRFKTLRGDPSGANFAILKEQS